MPWPEPQISFKALAYVFPPEPKFIENLHKIGTDRIELYTEDYAVNYQQGNYSAIDPYVDCAKLLNQLNIGVNAGHDLSLKNIEFFKKKIRFIFRRKRTVSKSIFRKNII